MGWTTSKEKRTRRRMAAQMPLRYRIQDDSGEWGERRRSKTTNVSSQGLAFASEEIIPITARLAFEATLPGRAGTFAAEGNLVRIARELPDDCGFEYGVALDMASVSDPGKLEAFVRSIDAFPLLELMTANDASDMHLTPYSPPILRVGNRLLRAKGDPLPPHAVEMLVLSLLNPERRSELTHSGETHFMFMAPETGRWRISAYRQRGCIEAVVHAVGREIPSVYDLNLPETLQAAVKRESGLIVVGGGLRSGKTTTIGALVDAINAEGGRVVSTLENPIEFLHENHRGIVKQREIGTDTPSVAQGVRHILRQDPDVVVVDTPVDAETLDLLLHAAETGRLVILSACAASLVGALDLFGSLHPQTTRPQAMRRLARSLSAAWWQALLPSPDGPLTMVAEMLTANTSIRTAVAQDRIDLIPGILNSAPGCMPIDAELRRLVGLGVLDLEVAMRVARFPDELQSNTGDRRDR